MKIVTVLRSGGVYRKEHVETLYEQCKKHAPNREFVCISDQQDVPGYVKMKHNWPSWWGKIETFLIEGPVLYLDLDTIVYRNIEPLINRISQHKFVCLRDFYWTPKMERTVGSGVMAWSGNMRFIYDEFAKDPERHMAECTTPRWWGDQGFIEKCVTGQKYFQDVAPREVVSWKAHCKGGIIPKDCSIIAFHGKPKPWEVYIK